MAANMVRSAWTMSSIIHNNLPLFSQVRWSRYSALYINPIAKKTELDKLEEEGKLKELTYLPVKTAPNNISCSVFNDPLINKFTNMVMESGKKQLARSLVEKAFENVKRIQLAKYHAAPAEERASIECNPRRIFYAAVENCTPVMMLSPVKRGGIRYQVPVPVTANRAQFMSLRWIIQAANEKERKVHFPESLAQELIRAAQNEGRAVRTKQDLHKQCEANKAYAHYRWA